MVMDNAMIQCIKEDELFRGDDTPSRGDLLMTKEPDIVGAVTCRCPIDKSDHVMSELRVREKKR